MTRGWADANPNTHVAILKAMIRACMWLDASPANRIEAVKILARSNYVGADAAVIGNSMTGTLRIREGRQARRTRFQHLLQEVRDLSVLQRRHLVPDPDAPLGQITEPKTDAWYLETAKKVYLPETYLLAARGAGRRGQGQGKRLSKTDGFKGPQTGFIDGVVYDGRQPVDYLSKLKIGLKNTEKA